MSMQLVNGVLCLNCSDVERAKKVGLGGSTNPHDPLHPSTVISNGAAATNGLSATNGAAESGTPTPDASQALGINQPLAGGDRGTQLNLLA